MYKNGLYGHDFDWLVLTQHSDMLSYVVTAPHHEHPEQSSLEVLAARGAGLWRYGYTQSSMIGKKVADVFPTHIAHAIKRAVDTVAAHDQATWTNLDWAGDHLLCVFIPVRVNGRLTYVEIDMIPVAEMIREGGMKGSMGTVAVEQEVKERDLKRVRSMQDLAAEITPDMLLRWVEHAGQSRANKGWLLAMKSVLDEVLGQWSEESTPEDAMQGTTDDTKHLFSEKEKGISEDQAIRGGRSDKTAGDKSTAPDIQERWVKRRIESFTMLTEREKEVLWQIVLGKRNREIAETLYISEHTVKNHISNIFAKLGIKDRMQLVALIYRA